VSLGDREDKDPANYQPPTTTTTPGVGIGTLGSRDPQNHVTRHRTPRITSAFGIHAVAKPPYTKLLASKLSSHQRDVSKTHQLFNDDRMFNFTRFMITGNTTGFTRTVNVRSDNSAGLA